MTWSCAWVLLGWCSDFLFKYDDIKAFAAKDWQWNWFDLIIVSFQIFEEVSSLIRSSANGEIHLSSSSSAIRIIRMPPGEIGNDSSAAEMVHPCSSVKPSGI